MTPRVLTIWVVYLNPSDFPGKYVVRGQDVIGPDPDRDIQKHADPLIVCETLEAARRPLEERGLYRLDRHDADVPQIVETWF